jgi:hypothetical protein
MLTTIKVVLGVFKGRRSPEIYLLCVCFRLASLPLGTINVQTQQKTNINNAIFVAKDSVKSLVPVNVNASQLPK